MKIHDTYSICRTGKLNQFYTLYISKTISSENFHNEVCYFVQNLAHDENESIEKVNVMMADRLVDVGHLDSYNQVMDFCDSKKREYCDLKIFGLEWKKTRKGFVISMDSLSKENQETIWNTWRTDKDALKEAGFSMFKPEYTWIFFFRNCTNEEMADKLAVLKLRKKEKVVNGSFLGKIKERITVPVTLKTHKEKVNTWTGGYTQIVTFEDDKGNSLISFYGGKKDIPKVGSKINLVGTVKKHEEFNGVRQTNLIRISL